MLAVNPDQVEALSLQAAIMAIEDRTADAERLAQRVLTLRPGSGAVYRITGAQLGRPLPLRRGGRAGEGR